METPHCGSCWHFELGSVVRVDPKPCPGCQLELLCRKRRRPVAEHHAS